MLTPEQIKSLKKGDKLLVEAYFVREKDGYHITCSLTPPYSYVSMPFSVISNLLHLPSDSQSSTVNSQSKYDPCRLFKKGDIVRLKEWNGRCPALPEDWKHNNGLFKVHEDEKFNSSVEITRENSKNVYIAPICYLELVTPVEEMEPYSVLETDTINGFDIMRDGLCVMTFPYGSKEAGYYRNEPAAKEAAEAECARLNTEYRKGNTHE